MGIGLSDRLGHAMRNAVRFCEKVAFCTSRYNALTAAYLCQNRPESRNLVGGSNPLTDAGARGLLKVAAFHALYGL